MSATTEAPATAAVMDRLRAGEAVTPGELAEAEAADRLAAMRAAAAAQAAHDEAETARLRRVEEIRAGLPKRLDPAPIEKARQRMAAAIDAYVAACADHDAALSEAWNELQGLGPLPAGVAANADGYGTVTLDGRVHRRASVQGGIARTATEVVKRRYPRTSIDLGRPPD